jgi:hypothetical protein
MFEQRITEDNFILIAMRHYDNMQCTSIAEFEEDIKRFSYLKKLLVRYHDNNDLRERLIINHIIILFNVFGIVTPELLFFKIDKEHWNVLATFLVFLGKMPDEIPEMGIKLVDLHLDKNVTAVLENI